MFLDVAHQVGLYQGLHEEAIQVLGHNWVRDDLASFRKMRFMDSAIQETLRLNPTVLHASNREVIHPDGLTLPTGQHLPRGSWVAASTLDVHLDERFYPDPAHYDPSRFLSYPKLNDSQSTSRLTTSSSFLTFGAGRHAW
jgi:cytochrome P450